jgi:hypothetical protein
LPCTQIQDEEESEEHGEQVAVEKDDCDKSKHSREDHTEQMSLARRLEEISHDESTIHGENGKKVEKAPPYRSKHDCPQEEVLEVFRAIASKILRHNECVMRGEYEPDRLEHRQAQVPVSKENSEQAKGKSSREER